MFPDGGVSAGNPSVEGGGGLVKADGFLAFMSETLKKKTFEELDTPMHIVAADLWHREQVVLTSGDLISAINASMAIPGGV